jgi:hypothetical protein
LEATVRVNTPNLCKAVAKRDAAVASLEHAIASEEINGVAPTHRGSLIVGEKVDSIEAYTKELKELNDDVKNRVEAIEAIHNETGIEAQSQPNVQNVDGGQMLPSGASSLTYQEEGQMLPSGASSLAYQEEEADPLAPNAKEEADVFVEDTNTTEDASGSGRNPFALGSNVLKATATAAASTAAAVAGLLEVEDGKFYEAGFVSFSKLSIVHAALQMVHAAPFEMETFAAPDPKDSKYGVEFALEFGYYYPSHSNCVSTFSYLDQFGQNTQRVTVGEALQFCGDDCDLLAMDDSYGVLCLSVLRGRIERTVWLG